MSILLRARDESGFTLTELLVSISAGLVVLGAILAMTTVATHNQDRIAKRVAANQRARPVLTRIVDNLHSACVAPLVSPVLAGTNTSITFLSRSGDDVAPWPRKRVITLSGTTLSENVYQPTQQLSSTSWNYAPTPDPALSGPLLTDVEQATIEQAPGVLVPVPLFRYYKYNGSQLTGPLPTPLSTTPQGGDAAQAVRVVVSFTTEPTGGESTLDLNSGLTLSDSATFRLQSPSTVVTEVNRPCQ